MDASTEQEPLTLEQAYRRWEEREQYPWDPTRVPLTAEERAAIRARHQAARPGPWVHATDAFNAYVSVPTRSGGRRARRGYRLRDLVVYAIVRGWGHGMMPDLEAGAKELPPGNDHWDYDHLLVLNWWAVKGNVFTQSPHEEDLEFMAHAREDVPRLLADLERAEARIAELEATLAGSPC